MRRKFITLALIGMLFSVPVWAKPVLSVGGSHNEDTTYFGLSYYNFSDDGLFLKTKYYVSRSDDWDAQFISLEVGYTVIRDTLPWTTYAGLSIYSFEPDQSDAADNAPKFGFWVGPSDSKWKIGASIGKQIFQDGSDPLYTEFSLKLFDFFYPRKTNYVLNLSVRFFKDKDSSFLWQFGVAF